MFEFVVKAGVIEGFSLLGQKELTRYDMTMPVVDVMEDGLVKIVATEGHQLSIYENGIGEGTPPIKMFPLIVSLFPKAKHYYKITVENDEYTVQADAGAAIKIKIPDNFRFPDYTLILPQANEEVSNEVAYLNGRITETLKKAASKFVARTKREEFHNVFKLWFNGPTNVVRFQARFDKKFYGIIMPIKINPQDSTWPENDTIEI